MQHVGTFMVSDTIKFVHSIERQNETSCSNRVRNWKLRVQNNLM